VSPGNRPCPAAPTTTSSRLPSRTGATRPPRRRSRRPSGRSTPRRSATCRSTSSRLGQRLAGAAGPLQPRAGPVPVRRPADGGDGARRPHPGRPGHPRQRPAGPAARLRARPGERQGPPARQGGREALRHHGPDADLAQLLESGITLGIGVAEKVWTTGQKWTPKLRYWAPHYLTWRTDTRSYWLTTEDGQVEVPEDGGGRFLVYAPYGYRRGWMKARVRALALPWLIRNFGRRDWARQSEVLGQPIKKAIVPAGVDDAAQEPLRRLPPLPGRRGAHRVPRPRAGPGQVRPAPWSRPRPGPGRASRSSSATPRRRSASRCWARTSPPRSRPAPGPPPRCTTASARTSRRPTPRPSPAPSSTSLLGDWARFHAKGDGTAELAPVPTWQTEPPEDENQRAQTIVAVATALKTLKDCKAPIDERALLEQAGIPLLSEAEVAEAQRKAALNPPKPGPPPAADPKPDDDAPAPAPAD
jgi:hypothetical protein